MDQSKIVRHAIWAATAIVVSGIFGIVADKGCERVQDTQNNAIKAGYIQKVVPGTVQTYWTAPEKEKQ
jgi:hypothetical protein